jgi:hypothetical protein
MNATIKSNQLNNQTKQAASDILFIGKFKTHGGGGVGSAAIDTCLRLGTNQRYAFSYSKQYVVPLRKRLYIFFHNVGNLSK